MTKKILPPSDANERRDRTSEVLSRYHDRALSWEDRVTCIHLFRAQAVAMGHSLPPLPIFNTPLGARNALRKAGCSNLVELLDKLLPGRRIPPAAMWVGDVALLPGDPFEALVIFAGGKVMGWHDSDLSQMWAIELSKAERSGAFLGAWRLG